MLDQGGAERRARQVATIHGDRLYTNSLTATAAGFDDAEARFDEIVSSWTWTWKGAVAAPLDGHALPMTHKADFDAEQWTTLTTAPALAATAVAAADRGGMIREAVSLAKAYQEARKGEHSELLEALLGSPPAMQPPPASDAGGLADHAATQVRAASDLLGEKGTPEEVREYGDFVTAVCAAVASASKEGGVLGFGGKPVSDAEQAVLDRIAAELGPRPGTTEPT